MIHISQWLYLHPRNKMRIEIERMGPTEIRPNKNGQIYFSKPVQGPLSLQLKNRATLAHFGSVFNGIVDVVG